MRVADEFTAANTGILAELGEDITYIPNQGAGTPLSEKAILLEPEVDQSRTPGYFGEIDVDPGLVRERKDEVIWPDAVVYVVTKVRRPDAYGLVRLTLHQK